MLEGPLGPRVSLADVLQSEATWTQPVAVDVFTVRSAAADTAKAKRVSLEGATFVTPASCCGPVDPGPAARAGPGRSPGHAARK